MNLFISGHSLVDQPFPDHLASIARSCGTPLDWNRQYMVGSSIRERTRGLDASNPSWVGYRGGIDRHDQPIDVLAELREPRGIEAGAYDVLLITEQHGLLGTLVWNDTVPMLRHFHDQFIGANPGGSTYFYEPWLGINDKNDPRRWIDYERAASPIWQCVVTRVNQSLAQEGRADRIISVPVGLALAELICAATTGTGLEHVTRGSVRQTVDGLIHDDVHATEAASYFVAAVTYAAIFRRSPENAAPPARLHRNSRTRCAALRGRSSAATTQGAHPARLKAATPAPCCRSMRCTGITSTTPSIGASWVRSGRAFDGCASASAGIAC
jgi:hypothetical protein